MLSQHTDLKRCALIGLLLVGVNTWAAPITSVADPTTNFNVVPFQHQNDFFIDQQTGQTTSDIVGDATNAGFYTAFDGTNVYYRVRLGATDRSGANAAFRGLFWIGI